MVPQPMQSVLQLLALALIMPCHGGYPGGPLRRIAAGLPGCTTLLYNAYSLACCLQSVPSVPQLMRAPPTPVIHPTVRLQPHPHSLLACSQGSAGGVSCLHQATRQGRVPLLRAHLLLLFAQCMLDNPINL